MTGQRIMRPLAIVAALLLCGLGAFSRIASAQNLEDAARTEGQATWYVSQVPGDIAELAATTFTRLHPGVKVNVVRITTQVAYQRASMELQHGTPICDVLSTTDIAHYKALKQKNQLARFAPPNAAGLSPMFRDFDPDGFYYPTYAGEVVLAYNTKNIAANDAPTQWKDLLDPKWNGKVAVGHPAFSGYAGNWVVMMEKLYGWGYFDSLEKNNPLVTRSIIDTVPYLNSGERWIAVSPSASVLESADKGNPIAIVYPSDGAILMVAPSAVLAAAPHPNAGKLFLDFLLGPDYARIAVKSRGEALRPDVPALPGVRTVDQIKTIRATESDSIDGIPRAIERWRDTFGG